MRQIVTHLVGYSSILYQNNDIRRIRSRQSIPIKIEIKIWPRVGINCREITDTFTNQSQHSETCQKTRHICWDFLRLSIVYQDFSTVCQDFSTVCEGFLTVWWRVLTCLVEILINVFQKGRIGSFNVFKTSELSASMET